MNMEVINLVENCLNETINKQVSTYDPNYINKKIEISNYILNEILKNDNYDVITRTNNSRNNMKSLGKDCLRIELVRGAFLTFSTTLLKEGKVPEKKDTPPETSQEAASFIMSVFQTQGSSRAYQIVSQYPDIQELLIENYSNLLATTTKQERIESTNQLIKYLGTQIKNLDNLESYLINTHRENIQTDIKTY